MKTTPARKGMRSRTPWAVKMRPAFEPQVVPDPRTGGKLLVPTPLLLAAEIRKVRRGRLITPPELRARLARQFGADSTCPLTVGIFLNIIAGATEDERAAGQKLTAPWWRVVDPRGRLLPKTPPGPTCQAALLRAEGHRIAGRPPIRVADFV